MFLLVIPTILIYIIILFLKWVWKLLDNKIRTAEEKREQQLKSAELVDPITDRAAGDFHKTTMQFAAIAIFHK